MIENKHIRSFLQVLDLGSFSRAARSLNIAQPALSQHVKKIEEDLGVRLLDRKPGGVTATEAGREFSRHARSILSMVDEAERRFRSSATNLFGEVSVGLPGSVCPVLAPPLLLAARERFPDIKLRLSELMSGDLEVMLREGRMDVALLFNVNETDDYSALPLVHEKLHLIGAPDAALVQGGQVAVADIVDVPLVSTRAPHGLRLQLEKWAATTDIKLNFSVEANSPSVLVKMASMGVCYSIVSLAALEAEIQLGTLATAEIIDPPCERVACLCASKRVPPDTAREAILTLTRDLIIELVRTSKWRGGRLVSEG